MSKVRSITPKDPADFTPELGNYKTLQPFRYWCQKVLPLVYDDSLSYYELLCKVVDYLNKTMEDVETLHGDVTNLHSAYEELQSYVNDYFSTLDVQKEINNKLDAMANDGTLEKLLKNVINPSPIMVDSVDKMSDHSTIYVLSTNGHVYYYNGTSFVDSGLSYTNNENYISRSLNILTSDIASTLREIPTNRAYGVNKNSPNIFPVKITDSGFLLKISPLTIDGFSLYILSYNFNNFMGYDNGTDIIWTRCNFYTDLNVLNADTFVEKFGDDFTNFTESAIIMCSGNIPTLGINLNGLYTLIVFSPKKDKGFQSYLIISDNFMYYGFNLQTKIKWTKIGYYKNSSPYKNEQFVSVFGDNFATYTEDAIIACNGNIPALGINLDGLYTIVTMSNKDTPGFNVYFAISNTFLYTGFNDGTKINWTKANITSTGYVYTNTTFADNFGEDFSNYTENAVIACSGIIDSLGINLTGTYTVIVFSPRKDKGFQSYLIIGKTYIYKGFNNGTKIIWTNIFQDIDSINNSYVNELNGKNIVICGDSIVAGVGGTGYSPTGEPIGNVPIHGKQQYRNDNGRCWANSLCQYILENYNANSAINNGISGINTGELSSNVSQIIPYNTNVAIICIGINDRGTFSDLETTVNNIRNIGAYCVQNNILPCFLTITQSTTPKSTYHSTYNINDAIHKACNNMYPCFNLFSTLISYLDFKDIELNSILSDGLHPNDNGYEIIYKIVKYLLGI